MLIKLCSCFMQTGLAEGWCVQGIGPHTPAGHEQESVQSSCHSGCKLGDLLCCAGLVCLTECLRKCGGRSAGLHGCFAAEMCHMRSELLAAWRCSCVYWPCVTQHKAAPTTWLMQCALCRVCTADSCACGEVSDWVRVDSREYPPAKFLNCKG